MTIPPDYGSHRETAGPAPRIEPLTDTPPHEPGWAQRGLYALLALIVVALAAAVVVLLVF